MSQAKTRTGFTLIEVLVVVAIIALLVAILIPSLKEAREQAYRVACAANFKAIGHAMSMYAEDTKQNYFQFNKVYNLTTGVWDGISMVNGVPVDNGSGTVGDDSCVALALDMASVSPPSAAKANAVGTPNKKYIRSWDVLVCPATKNKIRKADDLNRNADSRLSGPGDGKFGNSYEWWNGFQKADYAQPGSCVSGSRRLAYTGSESDTNHDGYPDCLKRPKIIKFPARIILSLDGDDNVNQGGAYEDRNNWPDSPFDNHSYKGWVILFADMHARWTTREQTWSVLDRSDMDTGAVPPEYVPKKGGTPPPPG